MRHEGEEEEAGAGAGGGSQDAGGLLLAVRSADGVVPVDLQRVPEPDAGMNRDTKTGMLHVERHAPSHPLVRPLRTEAEYRALVEAASADSHVVLAPTHLVVRDGEIVGYGSIGGAVLVNVWLDSRKVRARESLGLLNLAENLAFAQGARQIIMPCAENSPFHPLMEKFGYKRLGLTSLNLKGQ